MHNFKELIIWQKSMDLVTDVSKCSVSLIDDQKFVRFLNISNGSSCELETQNLIAQNIQFLSEGMANNLLNKLNEVPKMNHALRFKFE